MRQLSEWGSSDRQPKKYSSTAEIKQVYRLEPTKLTAKKPLVSVSFVLIKVNIMIKKYALTKKASAFRELTDLICPKWISFLKITK